MKYTKTSDETGINCYNKTAVGIDISVFVKKRTRQWERNFGESFGGEGLNSTLEREL